MNIGRDTGVIVIEPVKEPTSVPRKDGVPSPVRR